MNSTNSITRWVGKKAQQKGLTALMCPRQWVKYVFVPPPLGILGGVEHCARKSAISALAFYRLYVVSANPTLVINIPFVLYGLSRYRFAVEAKGAGESPTDGLLADPS